MIEMMIRYVVQILTDFNSLFFSVFNHEDSTIIVASGASTSNTSSNTGSSKNSASNSINGAKNFTATNSKQTTRGSTGANGEEEWKEVVRK